MINTNELLYVVDEFDTPLAPKTRREAFEKGFWRRTAQVWVLNKQGQLLCQKRSSKKDLGPGLWEVTVGGHIGHQDNYFTGAAREVCEETGLPVKPSDLNFVKIYRDDKMREFRGIFYYITDAKLHHITPEEEEVDKVKFLNLKTVKNYLLYKKHQNWISPGYEREMFSILS